MPDDGTHECPGPECSRRIPFDLLSCSRNWYQVPIRIRGAVYRARDEHGQGSVAHMAAIAAAVRYMRPLGPRGGQG